MALFAVHLPDFVLPTSWWVIGYGIAIVAAAVGCIRMRDRDVPLVALITAAFFVASSIRVPVPYGSVHLVLNGAVGIMLGYRAGLALFIGLTLQSLLVGHGGVQMIGVNTVLQTLPALAVGGIFRLAAGSGHWSNESLAILGGTLSFAAVLLTVVLQSILLGLAGDAGVMPMLVWFGIHIPVGIIEGVVVGFMIHFLSRVKPELIGVRRYIECDVPRAVQTDAVGSTSETKIQEPANQIAAAGKMR